MAIILKFIFWPLIKLLLNAVFRTFRKIDRFLISVILYIFAAYKPQITFLITIYEKSENLQLLQQRAE